MRMRRLFSSSSNVLLVTPSTPINYPCPPSAWARWFALAQSTLSGRSFIEAEIEKLQRFGDSLSDEDKTVFEDIMNQCKQYSTQASKLAYTNKEFPLMIAILFAQYRRVTAMEKQHVLKGWAF